MDENMNTNEVVETYDATETEVVNVDHSDAKAVAIGAVAATAVTAGIYGLYKLGGKVVAKVKTAKAKKQAEEEIAKTQAFKSYDEQVAEFHVVEDIETPEQ